MRPHEIPGFHWPADLSAIGLSPVQVRNPAVGGVLFNLLGSGATAAHRQSEDGPEFIVSVPGERLKSQGMIIGYGRTLGEACVAVAHRIGRWPTS